MRFGAHKFLILVQEPYRLAQNQQRDRAGKLFNTVTPFP